MGGAARRERTLEGRPLHRCLHLARRLARRLDQPDPPEVEPPPDVERCDDEESRTDAEDAKERDGLYNTRRCVMYREGWECDM